MLLIDEFDNTAKALHFQRSMCLYNLRIISAGKNRCIHGPPSNTYLEETASLKKRRETRLVLQI